MNPQESKKIRCCLEFKLISESLLADMKGKKKEDFYALVALVAAVESWNEGWSQLSGVQRDQGLILLTESIKQLKGDHEFEQLTNRWISLMEEA